MLPKTQYAKSGDVHISYQVFGDGPRDLIMVPGWSSQIEMWWENPAIVRSFERLGSYCRAVTFDKRGTGLSDRAAQLPILEEHLDDVRAVMNAVGSERAALLGWAEG